MADEDEIDILGDFSFNSCLAQNNQGIPSCSNREDTVHPQWLLDSIANNWYDSQSKDINSSRAKGPSRKLSGNNSKDKCNDGIHTMWNQTERELLVREMTKYGRNIRKISQTIKTKTEAEIQAQIEAEYGVRLETPSFGLDKHEDHDDIPSVVQEEIVTDEVPNILNIVATGSPTISMPFRRKNYNTTQKSSLLRPALIDSKKTDLLAVSHSELIYEDDLIIGSTESIGSDLDSVDAVSRNILIKQQKEKMKAVKKIGNHRRKVSRSSDRGKPRNRSKDLLKSPQGRQRKDSSLSEDNTKSPKMHIVFSSGQALPVSEGEQVIKIEKKKDSEPESDIEIDSDHEDGRRETKLVPRADEAPIAVPLRKFEPMPKRHKRINLDGGGGYTIMHTESGDLYARGAEPRKERASKRPPAPARLVQCRRYNAERPAPYVVRMHVSALIVMDAHAHTSRAEVMGLAGGRAAPPAAPALGGPTVVTLHAYRTAAAAACGTHCDMDPVSQAAAAESLLAAGLYVCAWHHSHPVFPPAPSALDLRTQRALQAALERARAPLLGLITSQHWPPGRAASQYRCIRAEGPDPDDPAETPTGYQFSVKLLPDLTEESLPAFLRELRAVLRDETSRSEYSVDMVTDVCPQAGITYLEKCISSIKHHMHSAGYEDGDPVTTQLIQGVRDVFR